MFLFLFNLYHMSLTLHRLMQNKEAEAKEELKRRAKQLEHQRREQQRIQRAQGPSYPASHSGGFGSSAGGGSGYSSGGMAGGYAPVSTSNITHDPYATPRTSSPAFSSGGAKAPAFKGTGMKLGAKRGNKGRDELMEALGSEAVVQESEPEAVREEVHQVGNAVQADEHVLPEVEKER